MRASWTRLVSGKRPAAFWLEVARRMRGKPRSDLRLVRAAIAEVEVMWIKRRRKT